jgi:hypothetical protein
MNELKDEHLLDISSSQIKERKKIGSLNYLCI